MASRANMVARISLSERDGEILKALTMRVRCLSVEQVASHWWSGRKDAVRNALARLRQLEEAGYLRRGTVLARPIPRLAAPLVVWSPGNPQPDFGPISYHLRHRFTEPVVSTPIVLATRRAASRFGGHPGRTPRRSETTHDLGLAGVYLHFCRHAPQKARRWIAEAELLHGKRIKVPDAVLRTRGGRETVIEFGGEYNKGRLEDFHADCARQERGYELW